MTGSAQLTSLEADSVPLAVHVRPRMLTVPELMKGRISPVLIDGLLLSPGEEPLVGYQDSNHPMPRHDQRHGEPSR